MMYKYVVFVICAVISADNGAANKQSIRAAKKRNNRFVGFYATLDEGKSLTIGQTVKYTNVVTNAGNHYDPNTGMFTAPRTAYYMFHMHALTPSGFWFQLIHNEIPRASFHGAQNTWHMGGNSALLKVKAGERVYVKAVYLPSSVYGDGTQHYTTFTGYLVGK